MFYCSMDGDSIGAKVGKAVLANDVDELHKVSRRIDAAQDYILHWCKKVDGIKISGGGDEATMAIPQKALKDLKNLRKGIEKSFGYTISVGVGKSLSEAGSALLIAKIQGKDRIVYFNDKTEKEIDKAHKRVKNGTASQEEIKLAQAYLEKAENMVCDLHKSKTCELHKATTNSNGKRSSTTGHEKGVHMPLIPGSDNKENVGLSNMGYKVRHPNPSTDTPGNSQSSKDKAKRVLGQMKNIKPNLGKSEEESHEGEHAPHTEPNTDDPCPYCADDEDNRTDDCAYCQDLDAEENADGTAGMHDCDACKEYDSEQQETGGIDDCPYCQEENITEVQANPDMQDSGIDSPDNCPQCQELYGDAIEEQPGQTGQQDPNLQGHETAEEVLDLLDQEPGTGDKTPEQEASQIDNTELPQGDAMKDNVSVKEDFGPAQRNDMSDSESELAQEGSDEPDMTDVLKDGLDDHAQEQKKQEVLNMVSQTLQGFKANKESLEATKDQNQPLYNSCIQMLKSMIELCKLLGLQPQMQQQSPQMEQPQQAPVQQEQSSPKEAAPMEGAGESPKN